MSAKISISEAEALWLPTLPSTLQRAYHSCNDIHAPKAEYLVQLRSGLRITFGHADATGHFASEEHIVAPDWIYLGRVQSVEDAAGNPVYAEGTLVEGMDVRVSEVVLVVELFFTAEK
jgi:hypothetical protein